MLTRYACIFSLILLGFLAMSSVPHTPTNLSIEAIDIALPPTQLHLAFQPQDRSDEYLLTKGILTSKTKEDVWYQCGVRVPKAEWYARATEIATVCVHTARPLGVDPVGQLATWQQESRLDPCALGTHPRAWAIKRGLLKTKPHVSYTKAEVEYVLADAHLRIYFPQVDLGLAQVLHPAYAQGATPSELLSVQGAVYSAKEMAHRGSAWKTDEPWIYWPGYKSQERRKNINWWVHRVMEIDFLHK